MPTTDTPPLTSVLVVLRSGTVRVQVAALPHIVSAISDLLDHALPAIWSLSQACEANLLSLLPRLVARGIAIDANPYYWRYQCSQGLVFAVKHDNLAMVEWLHAYCPSILPYTAMTEAARTGNLRLLEWLSSRHENAPWIPQTMGAAASTNQVAVLQWIHDHPKNVGCTPKAIGDAVLHGHIDTVKWFHEHYGERAKVARDAADAIQKGHTEVVNALKLAAGKGDLELAQWLLTKAPKQKTIYTSSSYKLINLTAWNGHLHVNDMMSYSGFTNITPMNPRKTPWTLPMSMATSKWCDGSTRTERMGALSPQWTTRLRADTSTLCSGSTRTGCTAHAIGHAAKYGHLAIVEWLHANQIEGRTVRAMDLAARNGHLDVVKFLHKHRTDGCTSTAMDAAAAHDHLEVVYAAESSHVEIVKWFHENRSEGCTEDAMVSVAACGHLEIVKFLHENRGEECTPRAMHRAAYEGHFEILLFLHAHRIEGSGCVSAIYEDDASIAHLGIVQ